jgi:hypothetical protein
MAGNILQFDSKSSEALLINMVQSICLPRLKDEDGNLEGPDTAELLNFQQSSVANLYTNEEANRTFKFNYSEKHVNVKCETQVVPGSTKFVPTWVEEPFVELGVNYAGYILINHDRSPIPMRINVMGVSSYDPAGNPEKKAGKERIGKSYWSSMLGLMVSEIMAAFYGAPQTFVE